MHLRISALMTTMSTQAGPERSKLCDAGWQTSATTADIRSKIAKGALIIARNLDGSTLRHSAAEHGEAGSVEISVTTSAENHA